MKKTMMLVIVLSLVFSGSLMAEGLGLGLTTGINMSKFVGDDAKEFLEGVDVKFNTGFAFGGFLTIPIGPLDGRVEALFSQNGAKYEGEEDGAETSIKFNLNSLSIPITAGLNVLPNLRVFAGPYFDIFLSGKTMLELSYEGVSFDEDEDIDGDDVTTVAMGIIVGAAYSILDNFEIELRMNRGLNSLDATDDELDFKPSVISARINFYLIR
jgi:hypothetical protein